MLKNIIRRYYQNVHLLKAYSNIDFLKQFILFPFDYYLRRGKSSFPVNITLALTLRCNAKCSMCALSELLNIDNTELTLEQYRHFVDSYAKYKPGFVIYGGEPFLRKDVFDVIRIIKNHKLSCGVFTNGLLLNKNMLKEIVQLKMNFVAFSVYGPAYIHDKIVGIAGAYDKVVENIRLLKQYRYGKPTKAIIHCTISDENIDYLSEMSNILTADTVRFGHLTFITEEAKEKIFQELSRRFPLSKIYVKSHIFNPDSEKTNRFIGKIAELMRNKKTFFTPELELEEIPDWYNADFKSTRKCFFIWRGVFIAPNGDVYPCMGNFYYRMGNILSEDFCNIWNNNKFVDFRLTLKNGLLSACSRCCRL